MARNYIMRLFVVSILFMLLISCAKGPFTKNGEALRGTWVWVRTDGGFGNQIHETPASTGKKISWVFTAGNTYKIYQNGQLYSGGTYQLIQRECIHDRTSKKWIDFSTPTDRDMMIESQSGKTINLSDEMYDGLGSEFAVK